jgi:hypothetical protein
MQDMMYKKAVRMKLRFQAAKGQITMEDLYGLSLEVLNGMANEVNERLNKNAVSFIPDATVNKGNEEDTLRLEILKDVILTKYQEQQARANAAELARRKQDLMDAFHQVQQKDLLSKTPQEIEAMIAALG